MFRTVAYFLAVRLMLPLVALAQSQDKAGIDRIFKAYAHTDTPGCSVGIDAQGRDTFTAAYGMADLEHGVINTPATVFEAGSVSKQFTAAAVMLLIERGSVSLDDDIRKYFPEIPAYERPITVRELLNHTSGLRDWGDIEAIAGWPRTTRDYKHADVLEIISHQRALNYAPGDAWSYTNSGYNLSAMLVERVSGMKLQAFMSKEFFTPLGMTSTQWRDNFRRVVRNRAIAYDPEESGWQQDMPFEDIYGNGGLLTTVGDLLKWNRNLTSGSLHGSIFQQMQKPGSLTDGRRIGYGFGFFLEDFQSLEEVSHSGATAGYRAWLGRIPSKGLSVAILCNAGNAFTTDMANRIMRMSLGLAEEKPKPPAVPAGIKTGLYRSVRDPRTMKVDQEEGALTFDGHPTNAKVRFEGSRMFVGNPVYGEDVWEWVEAWTPGKLGEFTGSYVSDEAETALRVELKDGGLVLRGRPSHDFGLKPTYADGFSSEMGSIHFVRGADGRVAALEVGTSRAWKVRFIRQEQQQTNSGGNSRQ
jgi:CubicO group peptidase (beta-lactamase class C family)